MVKEMLTFDKRIVWNPNNLKEVDEAKAVLRAWKSLGHKIELEDGSEMVSFRPHYGEAVVKAEPIPQKHVMRCLDETGDTVRTWDKENGREAKEAKAAFLEHLKEGGTAYSVRKDGSRKQAITEFDVDAEEIILVPKTVGR